jgi:tetratricopeptide (TPR) repeat protein
MADNASALMSPAGSWLHEPFLARAAEPSNQDGRHALGAFLTMRLADRFRPGEEPAHPLALAYQVRATRDYLLDLDPLNAEAAHLLEIVRLAEVVQQGGARCTLQPSVLAYAFWLEEALRLEEALDVVETALALNDGTSATEEIAGLLQRARVMRLLGRLQEARDSYRTAGSRAANAGDRHSVLLSRIGEAIVKKHLGSLPESERALRAIVREAEELQDIDVQARAHHDLGAVLIHMGRGREALGSLYQAFELYARQTHKLRALSDLGEALKREGRYGSARDAFLLVLEQGRSDELKVLAMIALLELSALLDDRLGFARWLRQVGQMVDSIPPERQADFHLQSGLGWAAFGEQRNAERSLRKAISTAEQYHLHEYEFRAERALGDLTKQRAASATATAVAPEADDCEEFVEIGRRLHALLAS